MKNNKKTTGKITIKCNENGKKAVFTAVAVNGVKGVTLGSVTGMTDNTASGAAVYYLIMYNNNEGTGYKIIKIMAAEEIIKIKANVFY